jgi:hypothetical protein
MLVKYDRRHEEQPPPGHSHPNQSLAEKSGLQRIPQSGVFEKTFPLCHSRTPVSRGPIPVVVLKAFKIQEFFLNLPHNGYGAETTVCRISERIQGS